MIEFPESYFEVEKRNGFTIEKMMKRAWAAQMEMLETIREICDSHDIKWFADYGTLLGAVRHRGFIPWDDDIDIGMTRDNLNRFVYYARQELPDEYKVLCIDDEYEYNTLIVRVVNATNISTDEDRMTKFHGCPYVMGIDIFPYDYLPDDASERDTYLGVMNALFKSAGTLGGVELTGAAREESISMIESLTGGVVDRNRPLCNAINQIIEQMAQIYNRDECLQLTGIWRILWQPKYIFEKSWLNDLIELPFENITVPVPKEYDQILTLKYGQNYMTPVKDVSREYPFYKRQEKILTQALGYKPL